MKTAQQAPAQPQPSPSVQHAHALRDGMDAVAEDLIGQLQVRLADVMVQVGEDPKNPALWRRRLHAALEVMRHAVSAEETRISEEDKAARAAYSGYQSTFQRGLKPPDWHRLPAEEQNRWVALTESAPKPK